MTPLRQRMIDAMVLRGFATRTHKTYLSAVALMARHHHCSPALLSDEQVQAYLLYLLQERQRPRSTVDITSCAVRFLVCDVLGQDQRWAQTPMGPAPLRLPEVLSRADDRPVQATCVRSAMALHFSRCGHRPGGGSTKVGAQAWPQKRGCPSGHQGPFGPCLCLRQFAPTADMPVHECCWPSCQSRQVRWRPPPESGGLNCPSSGACSLGPWNCWQNSQRAP